MQIQLVPAWFKECYKHATAEMSVMLKQQWGRKQVFLGLEIFGSNSALLLL